MEVETNEEEEQEATLRGMKADNYYEKIKPSEEKSQQAREELDAALDTIRKDRKTAATPQEIKEAVKKVLPKYIIFAKEAKGQEAALKFHEDKASTLTAKLKELKEKSAEQKSAPANFSSAQLAETQMSLISTEVDLAANIRDYQAAQNQIIDYEASIAAFHLHAYAAIQTWGRVREEEADSDSAVSETESNGSSSSRSAQFRNRRAIGKKEKNSGHLLKAVDEQN